MEPTKCPFARNKIARDSRGNELLEYTECEMGDRPSGRTKSCLIEHSDKNYTECPIYKEEE
jgi:hypothetical protein